MKKDIKVTIRPTFYNDDNELQEEAWTHYINDAKLSDEISYIDGDNYETLIDDDTVAVINEFVSYYYDDKEYPALSHRIDFDYR